MGEIFRPASLTGADAAKGILEQLEKLNDPANRKKINDDIVAAHKLNETEAKKHADALALIDKHKTILDETNFVAANNKIERQKLDEDKKNYLLEKEDGRKKIEEKISQINAEIEETKKLQNEAISLKNTYADREGELKTKIENYNIDVKKLNDDRKKVNDDLDVAKNKIKEAEKILDEVKSKREAISKIAM